MQSRRTDDFRNLHRLVLLHRFAQNRDDIFKGFLKRLKRVQGWEINVFGHKQRPKRVVKSSEKI